jgi:hypothetical protein
MTVIKCVSKAMNMDVILNVNKAVAKNTCMYTSYDVLMDILYET